MKDWLPYRDVHGAANTISGTVLVWPSLDSPQLGRSREIHAYLPPSLADARARNASPGRRYPVIYFHDGQNMFDDRRSFAGEWHVDETLERLAGEGLEAIAVALPNAGDARMDEYNPWRQPNFARGRKGEVGGMGDAYLAWLVDTVKPLIDRSFPTSTDRASTGLAGSSMGALISLYGLIAYPAVFGFAAAMSPSLRWNDYGVLRLIDQGRLPPVRVHVDMGGREWRGMMADARRLRDLLLAKGWVEGRDLNYVEERYGNHREEAWARRLPGALRFLLAETIVSPPSDELAAPTAALPGARQSP